MRPSRKVRALAESRTRELEQNAQEMLAMKVKLKKLLQYCHGDDRPACHILETLASDPPAMSR